MFDTDILRHDFLISLWDFAACWKECCSRQDFLSKLNHLSVVYPNLVTVVCMGVPWGTLVKHGPYGLQKGVS